MAPEVISLLSSPEPEPLPSKAPARTSRTLGGFGQIVAKQASAALYEFTDRIPESSNPCPSVQPKKDEWWYSSDDFDITGDLKGDNDRDADLFLDNRPKKRRRLSGSPLGSPMLPVKATKPGAPKDNVSSRAIAPRSPPRGSKLPPPADVIELLSSPIGSPIAPYRRTTTVTKTPMFPDDGGISDSSISNPFLSSSPPPRKSKEPAVTKVDKGKERENVPCGGHAWISPKKAAAWDPISSSAPATNGPRSSPAARPLQRSRSDVITLDDSDPALSSGSGSGSGSGSDDEFPDDLGKLKTMKLKRPTTKSRSAKPKATSSNKSRITPGPKKTAEEREAERAQKKAEKELAKEEAKRLKEAEKARRAQEKEQAAALADVNKIRTDKKVSTPEMLVDLPSSLPETTRLQTELLLHDLQVDSHAWTSPVGNVVKWRRKVRSKYNPLLGHWEPVPMSVQDENHAMAILTAAQFVDLVVAAEQPDSSPSSPPESESLTSHVTRLKRHFPGHTLIYLIEGLTPWLRKNRTVRDRHFQAAVRSGLPSQAAQPAEPNPSSSSSANPRRKTKRPAKSAVYVDEDLIEDALLSLQISHGALIHHIATPLETARQIAVFTQHLSTLPYRRVKDESNLASAGFCMEAGQVKTGDGKRDTYVRMLQEITRVTAPIAYGIAGEFGSVADLVRGLEEGGPLRLEDVRRCVDLQGTVGDKRVGQAVSKRVWKVFTGRDEGSMDV
ncbi:Crossover junction endonuclease eme1 [Coniochaeta hoffmannii]|uniref:Crossover junction endonuclease eme1 n=1 Tax=Coniochaeta hoffmannii TaxID=91930 RepID=A0AA38RS04_9PEZI|nr:Crossover junction endonuclease eme1 [Coniochaeta hoffmannii]